MTTVFAILSFVQQAASGWPLCPATMKPRRIRPCLLLGLGLEVNAAAAQLRGHLVDVILVEVEFLGDLLVRQIEAY